MLKYLDPPFGCQISAPNGLFLVGFLGLKFQTRLEDSGMHYGSKTWKQQLYKPVFSINLSHKVSIAPCITRWWFQIFFILTPTWGNDPIWLIFFKWAETTNEIIFSLKRCISWNSSQPSRLPRGETVRNSVTQEFEMSFFFFEFFVSRSAKWAVMKTLVGWVV